MKKIGLFLLAFFLLAFPGCQSITEPEPGVSMGFVDLLDARVLRVDFPHARVFRSREEWEPFWRAYCHRTNGEGEQLPPVEVDFSSHMLVAVFYGVFPSGCSNWADEWIESITRYPDRIEVQVGQLPPLGDCTAVAWPLQIVLVDRIDLPVHFQGQVPG